MRFQLLNGFAEGGVGHIQRVRGAGKAAGFDNAVKALRAENRSIIRFITVCWRSLSTEGRVFFRLGHFSASGRLQCFPYPAGRVREPACLYSNQGNAP